MLRGDRHLALRFRFRRGDTRAAASGAALTSAARAGAGVAPGRGGSEAGATGSICGAGFTTSAAIGVDGTCLRAAQQLDPDHRDRDDCDAHPDAEQREAAPGRANRRQRRRCRRRRHRDRNGRLGGGGHRDRVDDRLLSPGNTSTGSLASADVDVGGFTCVGSESVSVTSGITTADGGAFRIGGGVFRIGAGVGGGRSSAWAGVSDRAGFPAAGATVGRTDGARAGAGAAIVRATAAAAPPRAAGGADGAATARTDAEVARAGAGAAGGDSAIASGAGDSVERQRALGRRDADHRGAEVLRRGRGGRGRRRRHGSRFVRAGDLGRSAAVVPGRHLDRAARPRAA